MSQVTEPSHPAGEDSLSARARLSLRERVISGAAYSFLAIIVSQSLAMATSVVYARLLGTQNLGILWIYVQMTDLVMAFVGLGLSVPTARFVSQFKSDPPKLERFVSTTHTGRLRRLHCEVNPFLLMRKPSSTRARIATWQILRARPSSCFVVRRATAQDRSRRGSCSGWESMGVHSAQPTCPEG